MNISEVTNKGKVTYSAKDPYLAKVKEIRSLNKPGSTKENLHVVLDLGESEITYQVGSSVGLYPENAPQYVKEILTLLRVCQNDSFFHQRSEERLTFGDFLAKSANLGKVTLPQLKWLSEKTANSTLLALANDKEKRKEFIENNNLFSLLTEFWDPSLPPEEFCNLISPMLPRFYSIASSSEHVGNEVHLMVASFSYEEAGRPKKSITTEYLLECCKVGGKIAMFVQPNHTFSLPADASTPVIMVGPGTGLAAFRGFIQDRFTKNPSSQNWLFTGDRERAFDFHYEEELAEYASTDFLRLDTAFSRDSAEKEYVQDKMWAAKEDLWDWIYNKHAHFYISGDAKKMAKDVQAMLQTIAGACGNLSEEEAKSYIKLMKKEKRLLLDVY